MKPGWLVAALLWTGSSTVTLPQLDWEGWMAIPRQDLSRSSGVKEGDNSRSGLLVNDIPSMDVHQNGLDHVIQYTAQKDPIHQLVYINGENQPGVQDRDYSEYLGDQASRHPEGQLNSRYGGREEYNVVQDSDYSDYFSDQAATYAEGPLNPVRREDYSVVQYSDYSDYFEEHGNSSRDHASYREVERVDYSDYNDYLDIKLGYKEGTIPEDQAAFYSSWRDPLDPLRPSYSSDLGDYPVTQASPVTSGTTLGPGGVVQRPGILTEMLDLLALALGDYSVLEWRPSVRRGEEERRRRLEREGWRRKNYLEREEGWRRTTNFTEVLHSKLPEGQVIILDRATLDGVATSKELLLRVLEWFAWILCDLLFQAFWPD